MLEPLCKKKRKKIECSEVTNVNVLTHTSCPRTKCTYDKPTSCRSGVLLENIITEDRRNKWRGSISRGIDVPRARLTLDIRNQTQSSVNLIDRTIPNIEFPEIELNKTQIKS